MSTYFLRYSILIFAVELLLISVFSSVVRAGNIFAGTLNNTIHEYSPTGADLGVFASSGLNQPFGLAFDSSGNLFAGNFGDNTIHKFSPTGADLGVFANTGLNGVTYLAFDPSGDLLALNFGSGAKSGGSIHKFAPDGTDLGQFVNLPGINPIAMAFDKNGKLFVTDTNMGEVYTFDSSGNSLGNFFLAGRSGIDGLAFGPVGDLYISGLASPGVEAISQAGVITYTNSVTGIGAIAFDSNGSLYAAQYNAPSGATTKNLYRIDAPGTPGSTMTTIATLPRTDSYISLAVWPAPEPSTFTLATLGGIALVAVARRRAVESRA